MRHKQRNIFCLIFKESNDRKYRVKPDIRFSRLYSFIATKNNRKIKQISLLSNILEADKEKREKEMENNSKFIEWLTNWIEHEI